jgi:hypothetical protein
MKISTKKPARPDANRPRGEAEPNGAQSPKAAAKRIPGKVAAKHQRGAEHVAPSILSAPKGPRNASHRRIQEAVDKVFRNRTTVHG